MRISAVILSYNSARYIETAVRSLADALAAEPGGPDEAWVVENGSTDGSKAILRALADEFPGWLNVIDLDRNTGTTASRNRALRRAAGRYVLVMDSDVELPRGTLGPLLARLDDDPSCGLVAPRLVYPDGRSQMSTDVFPTVGRKLARFLALRHLERGGREAVGPRTVDYAISAFWLLRRDVIEAVGPLDERIFYSPEDVDYCLRIWAAGYKVVHDPTVHAVHDAQEISRGLRPKKSTLSHARGLAYLFRKHGYALGRRRLYRRLGRPTHPAAEPTSRPREEAAR